MGCSALWYDGGTYSENTQASKISFQFKLNFKRFLEKTESTEKNSRQSFIQLLVVIGAPVQI